jgi:hypothetical protein
MSILVLGDTPVIHAGVVTLHLERCLWCHGLEDEMVVTVGAVLVTERKMREKS